MQMACMDLFTIQSMIENQGSQLVNDRKYLKVYEKA